MKKSFYVVVLFLLSSISYGQEITLELYGRCFSTNSIIEIDFYTLRKDSLKIQVFPFDSGLVVLPEMGTYTASTSYTNHNEEVTVTVKNKGLNRDTITVNSIQEMLLICDTCEIEPYWYCCGEKCDGYLIDYYSNGNKRIEGLFKNGKAVGVLKSFLPTGMIYAIWFHDKKGNDIRVIRFETDWDLMEKTDPPGNS